MAFVRSKKGETVEKELLIAYVTFNRLRATMQETATALGLPANRRSFVGTISLVRAYAPLLAAATTKKDQEKSFNDFRRICFKTNCPFAQRNPAPLALTRKLHKAKAPLKQGSKDRKLH
jgi:hypothetical protein